MTLELERMSRYGTDGRPSVDLSSRGRAPTLRLAFLAFAAVPQFYIVRLGGGSYVSLLAVMAIIAILVPPLGAPQDEYRRPLLIVGGLLLVQSASLLWSSNVQIGVRTLVYEMPIIACFAAATSAWRRRPRVVFQACSVYAVWLIVQALSTIVFRLFPSIEESFLESKGAGFFINPNTLAVFTTGTGDNIFDPAKAGGFFGNANVAAAALGVSAFSLVAISCRAQRKGLLRAAAFISWIAVFFTGSTFGLLLGVVGPVCLWALRASGGKMHARILVLAAGVVGFSIANMEGLVGLAAAKEGSTTSRISIWEFAGTQILRHPFSGIGFGGWEESYPSYAYSHNLSLTYPPHNSLLYLWLQSGVVAVVLVASLYFFFLKALVQRMRTADLTSSERMGVASCILACSWLALQAVIENYGMLGDEHMSFALPVAIVISLDNAGSSTAVKAGVGAFSTDDIRRRKMRTA